MRRIPPTSGYSPSWASPLRPSRHGSRPPARRGANVPLGEAMALTGHRSVQTAVRDFQAGAVEKYHAENILGSDSLDKP